MKILRDFESSAVMLKWSFLRHARRRCHV